MMKQNQAQLSASPDTTDMISMSLQNQTQIDKQRFDLQIVLVNVQQSFGLARVKQRTTIFEIKQAIEKLKQFRIEMQSLRLPDYLALQIRENIMAMDSVDDDVKQQSIEQTLLIEDHRTMHSYQIFNLMPDPATGVRVPFLFLELSRQPVLLTISPSSIGASQQHSNEQREEIKQQLALSRAAQENGPTDNQRQAESKQPGNSDVGGSQTQNPLAEDVELEVFMNCSVHCIKYALWRRLQIPIQNLVLNLPGQAESELHNSLEIRHFVEYQEPALDYNEKKPSLQQFMSKPLPQPINIDLTLSIVNQAKLSGERGFASQSQAAQQQPGHMMMPVGSHQKPTHEESRQQRAASQSAVHHYASAKDSSALPQLSLAAQLGSKMQAPDFKNMGNISAGQRSNNERVGIDFTFNTIKDVKKVSWKESAPWFREINDGFCWLAYCENDQIQQDMYLKAEMRARYGPQGTSQMRPDQFQQMYDSELQKSSKPRCPAYKQLVVINRGYEIFQMKKEMTNGILRCPCCRTSKYLVVKNCGFVNCEWSMRGVLKQNRESKIYADGRTYDGKLYTFKECDYQAVWLQLDIMAKKLDANSVQNTPYPTSNDFRKRELRIQQKAALKQKAKQDQSGADGWPEGSRRSQFRSQERQMPGVSGLLDSDSDSDDLVDLAVLKHQAAFLQSIHGELPGNISQSQVQNPIDRLAQTEQFRPGLLSNQVKSIGLSPKGARKLPEYNSAGKMQSSSGATGQEETTDPEGQACQIF